MIWCRRPFRVYGVWGRLTGEKVTDLLKIVTGAGLDVGSVSRPTETPSREGQSPDVRFGLDADQDSTSGHL